MRLLNSDWFDLKFGKRDMSPIGAAVPPIPALVAEFLAVKECMKKPEQDTSLHATPDNGGVFAALRKSCVVPFLVFMCGLLSTNAIALTATGSPSTCTNDTSIGTVNWTTPTFAYASDNAFAQALLDNATSRYLHCTGYGFAISAGATIQGITVNVERKSDSTQAGGSNDAAVRLIKGGAIGTTDRSTTTMYTTTDTVEAHGSTSDLWGTTWTAADINAANFGVAFAAIRPNPGGGVQKIDVDHIQVVVTYTPVTTTLADGTNPGNVTLAPSAAITDLDSFTLATSSGTDSVTALTVTLTGANSFQSLSEVRITSNDGATTYFSAVANPASNTVTFSGGTPIPVTTTTTTFKVRITPKTHANMPVPPGLSYAVGGTVTAFTSTNAQAGSDSASATVTIDNLSPAGATATSGTAGNASVTLNWTTSASTDFSRSVMLRWTGSSAGAEVPAEGADYAVGNTIGTATVVCVRTTDAAATAVSGIDGAGTGGCSATALTNGQAYTYKIFQNDARGNYDTGVTIGAFTPVVTVSSFNAFETATAAGATTGVIKTKIAGSAFSLDVVAISGGAQSGSFTSAIKVELLGNTVTGVALDANNCPISSTLLQTVTPNPTLTAGRSTVNFAAVADAWKDVRVRISFPTTSPTVTSCSTDNFAIRPNSLSVSVKDADWQTAGTTRTLNNSGATGGNVHKAGQPFTISATAYNAAAAITGNYAGSPAVQAIACTLPTPTCTNGTLTPGAWAAAGGTVTSATATYSEAGSFNLTLQDTTFASVDAADGTPATCAGYYVCSAAVLVGRFAPDHFDGATANTPQLLTFNNATCATRSFTYIGQPFGYKTLPQATFTAKNASGNPTVNYSGALWKLGASDVSQSYTYTLTPVSTPGLTSVIDTPTVTSNNNGSGTVSPNSGDTLSFNRNATTPQAPFTAAINLSMSVSDGSEAAVTGNGIITTSLPAQFSSIAFDSGNEFRYGVLKLTNAHGSELLDLPMRWPQILYAASVTAGIPTWALNDKDSCTSLNPANVSLVKIPAGCTTVIKESSIVFAAGRGGLTFSKPLAACYADATVNLAAEGKAYLQGKWGGAAYNQNSSARVTFGTYKSGPIIYMRENF